MFLQEVDFTLQHRYAALLSSLDFFKEKTFSYRLSAFPIYCPFSLCIKFLVFVPEPFK